MDIFEIITYVFTGISLLIGVCSLLITIVKWVKSGNFNKVKYMLGMIPELVIRSEQMFGKGNGVSKFDYVMTQLRLYALQNRIHFNEKEIREEVEKVVDATNQVNVDKPFPVVRELKPVSADSIKVDDGGQSNSEDNKYF